MEFEGERWGFGRKEEVGVLDFVLFVCLGKRVGFSCSKVWILVDEEGVGEVGDFAFCCLGKRKRKGGEECVKMGEEWRGRLWWWLR